MKYLANILALLWNMALVYAAYFACRVAFWLSNMDFYRDLSWSRLATLFGGGLTFDTSAIIYTNAIIILLFLIPLPCKERPSYYKVTKWIYVIVNMICVVANLADCVYFRFTGKRTTMSVFQEFGNEGAGELLKIFGQQLAANWPLLLVAVALGVALWKLFLSPPRLGASPHRPTWRYWAANLGALAVMIPLAIGGMRGGFTKATRPITISNANQWSKRPTEAGLVLNTPFSLIRTAGKRAFVVPDYMPMEEASAIYSPVHSPSDTAAFRPLNVVVMIVESFGKENFGFYNRHRQGYQGFTPFLDSLIEHEAYTFKFSYCNGRKSIEGMPPVLSSLPNFVEPLFLTPASLNAMSGLARELTERKGYRSAFFHGAQNGSMGFQAFANATGFERYYGRAEYERDPRRGGSNDFDGTWAIWDEEFLQFYCDKMSEMPQPFMTAVFTASSHSPFRVPERYEGRFPKGTRAIDQCVGYTDHALRRFFDSARRQPWFANTLFVITCDHTSHTDDPYYQSSTGSYAAPIILYAPGDSTLRGYDTERVVEQIDIMPTVLSYLGYDQPYIAFGKDIFNTAPADCHALHWLPGSNSYEYLAGDYALEFDGQRLTAAYRFKTDSLLTRDVLDQIPPDELRSMERTMKSIIQQYMWRMNNDALTIKR